MKVLLIGYRKYLAAVFFDVTTKLPLIKVYILLIYLFNRFFINHYVYLLILL